MFSSNLLVDPRRERLELIILGCGLTVIATLLAILVDGRIFPAFLLVLALLAIIGAACYRHIGHDLYLTFALVAMAIGRIASPVILFIAFVLAVGMVGSVIRIVGLDRLQRNFKRCRSATTMLRDVPATDPGSFRRQS